MEEFVSIITNSRSSQTLCSMELWPPEQGSIKEALPVSIDLDFDCETVRFPSGKFIIRALRATVFVSLEGADLVRGSRLGEYVHEPHLVAEVTQSVSESLEKETDIQGRLEVEVRRDFFGRVFGFVNWKKRRNNRAARDHVIKLGQRVDRIIPRTLDRWTIVEPMNPHLLAGRYIGSDGDKQIGPLCLITMRGRVARVRVVSTVSRDDLDVSAVPSGARRPTSRNKEAVMATLVRRSLSENQSNDFVVPPLIEGSDIVLANSIMEISVADTEQ